MSNEEQTAWLITAVESNGDDKSVKLSLFGYPSDGLRATLRLYAGRRITVKLVAFPAQPSGVVVDKNGHALTAETEAARAEGFAAGLTRARDLLAAHADESEATARGQATVRELGYKLDSAGHEWFETEKERDAARADLATLRRLALDAVNAVGLCPCHDPDGDCAKIRALSDALPPEVSDA